MPRKKPHAASKFRVYRPASNPVQDSKTLDSLSRPNVESGGKPLRLFNTAPKRAAEPTRQPSVPSRFQVYEPPPQPIPPPPGKPNGSAWIEHDGMWVCVYGCKSFWIREAPNGVADNDYHAYNCPYWFNEGIDQTPF